MTSWKGFTLLSNLHKNIAGSVHRLPTEYGTQQHSFKRVFFSSKKNIPPVILKTEKDRFQDDILTHAA